MKRLLGLLLGTLLVLAVFMIAESSSDKSVTVIRIPSLVLGERFNPCEEEMSLVSWTDVKMIVREVEHPEGHSHIIDTWIAKLTDEYGYRGQVTWPWKVQVGETVTKIANLVVTAHKPGTGQTIRIHTFAHVTMVDGVPVVNFEIDDFLCVGKPSN